MTSSNGTQLTHHKGRLLKEILEGQVYLIGTGLVRYNFAFCIGERAVGLYGIRSIGEKKLRAIRAWNRGKETWDPISGIYVPTFGRQFGRINKETPLFLVIVGRKLGRSEVHGVTDLSPLRNLERLRAVVLDGKYENIEILG